MAFYQILYLLYLYIIYSSTQYTFTVLPRNVGKLHIFQKVVFFIMICLLTNLLTCCLTNGPLRHMPTLLLFA
jgi:hypothetical protein